MKIVLLQPPVRDFYNTDIRLIPLGLSYLKASAQKYHPDIDIIIRDYHKGHGKKTIPIPKELEYLKEYYKYADQSPFCTFHQYYHFGLGFDQIVKELKELNPDLIGISALFSPYFNEVLTLSRRIKEEMGKPILVGGSHVAARPDQVLKTRVIDYIIRGEGEKPFVEFIKFLKGEQAISKVPGLGYIKDEMPVLNSIEDNYPLDELSIPDLSEFDKSKYQYSKSPLAFMITSRGCPHKCTFCSVHLTSNKYRRRSISCIIKEIKMRYDEGFRIIDFEDDNLNWNKTETRELLKKLISLFPNGEMEFMGMNGVAYIGLDHELLTLMRQANFKTLNIALVSLDAEVNRVIKRPHDPKHFELIAQSAYELGFEVIGYQILGLPHETLSSMIETLAFLSKLPILLGASPFYLTPGSAMESQLSSNGKLNPNISNVSNISNVLSRLTSMGMETPHLGRDEIYTLFITTRIINFLKGLSLEKDNTPLSDILSVTESTESPKSTNQRTQIGILLLNKLFGQKTLYYWTKKGLIKNHKFIWEIADQIFQSAGIIRCQNGKTIKLD